MQRIEEEQRQARFFDDCARRGDMADFEPAHLEKVRRFLDEWDIHPGQRILEPGCGSGRLSALLAERIGPDGELLALDLSQAMLARARERRLPPQVRLLRASAYAVPRPPASIDKILCFCVFPHFRQPQDFLAEARRLLTPDGELWINHLEGSATLNDFHRGAGRAVADHRLEGQDLMRELFRRAGFELLLLEDQPEAYRLRARPQNRP